jgi:hypothetical protein
MKPYTSPVILTLTGDDYFGDDYSLSQPLNAYSDAVGYINSIADDNGATDDIDVFEYTAVKEGLYVFESYGDTDTYAALYAQNDLDNPVETDDNSGADNNFRLSATLAAGERYYLYVSGSETGEYRLKALYAIGNIFGTVSPVKYTDYESEFNADIESKVTLTTYGANEFVAAMHLKEWSGGASEYASFDMTGIHGDTYLVSFTRPGYLTRYRKIVLDDDVVDLGNVALLAGDVNADGVINSADSALLQTYYGKSYGDAGYNISADLNGDQTIDSGDLALLTPNLNKNANVYAENVNVIKVSANAGNSALNVSGTAAADSNITVNVTQGGADIFSEPVTVDSSGNYSTVFALTKAGKYTVTVTAENRAFEAAADANY